MKNIALIILIHLSVSAVAEIPLKFNNLGEFVPPDMILQLRALESYEKGFKGSSLTNFKKSAKFGNERSKYLIALMKFQDKDWATGYAWLELIKESNEDDNGLKQRVKSMLTPEELNYSVKILEKLRAEYNDETSFKRRNKWERSIKGIGTHISGVNAMTIRNVAMNFGDASGNVQSYDIQKEVHNYVEEYVPKGIVTLDVIKEIETQKVD